MFRRAAIKAFSSRPAIASLIALFAFFYTFKGHSLSGPEMAGIALAAFVLCARLVSLAGSRWLLAFHALVFLILMAPAFFQKPPGLDLVLYFIFMSTAGAVFVASAAFTKIASGGATLCLILCVLLPESILSGYVLLCNQRLGPEQINVLMETNFQEALGYLFLHIGELAFLLTGFGIAAVLLLLLGLFIKTPDARRQASGSLFCALILIAAALSTDSGQQRLNDIFVVERANQANAQSLKTAADRAAHLDQIGARLMDKAPAIYLIVVGESANRNHLHAYGYYRETTPYLDAMDQSSLALFRNAISSYSMTSASLRRALTLATVESRREYKDPGMYSLFEILRSAGVKAYWITNQSPEDGQLPLITANADQWPSDYPALVPAKGTDESLLPSVLSLLSQKQQAPTVLFLHLRGSHYPYAGASPAAFAKFQESDDATLWGPRVNAREVNRYDNSIAYTDFILHKLIGLLEGADLPSSLLYFSDHGESPFIGAGHDPGLFSIGHVEVPLFIWFSPQYKKNYPNIVSAAQGNVDKAFMLDKLPQTIMTLTHVDAPFYKPESSLLTPAYIPRPRWTLDGALDYDQLGDDYCTVTKKQTGFAPGKC